MNKIFRFSPLRKRCGREAFFIGRHSKNFFGGIVKFVLRCYNEYTKIGKEFYKMDVTTAKQTFLTNQKKLMAFRHAGGVMYYDSVTAAPAGSEYPMSKTGEVFAEETFKLSKSEEMVEAICCLYEHREELDYVLRREVEEEYKHYERTKLIPMEEYIEYSRISNEAQYAWHRAKNENDYASFEPLLSKVVAMQKKFAQYENPDKPAYDVLLDRYEKGLSIEVLDRFFGLLKEKLVPVIHAVCEKKQLDDSFLSRRYPVADQRIFSDYLMEVLGIDRNFCCIGETEHPFTTSFTKKDVRITTHYHENALASSMYSVIHEGGHALYELNPGDELLDSPLSGGTTMGMHEAQSRFFENIVGRSQGFIEAIMPRMKEIFPEQLKDVTAEMMYRAVNKSEPSLIRTEADELTYPIHVMIRYEIEKMLFNGSVTTKELPELWNRLYKEYLGVDVPNDTQGVLQDSHWSGGMLGYFPSYAIGSAYAAQIYHHMKKELDAEKLIAEGNLKPIVEWLTEHIYKYGGLKKPDELMLICCGEPFDANYYVDYLTDKFTKLYGLDK